jgi:aminoglycoside phosphotransferase (APT) family kinase protein
MSEERDATAVTGDIDGIDVANVTAWFEGRLGDEVTPPLSFSLIAGGHSNLTYRVEDAEGRPWVLRRPPLAQVLATAHDMSREFKIISALGPTEVPVAPAVGLCMDEGVNGAPFYVMGFVEGTVVRDAETARRVLTEEQRRTAGESIVDVLAAIHAVDVDAVGLGDLGRKEGYIERQLKRWYGQWEKSKTRELPEVDEVHDELLARVPAQGPATIVHGDYRLDNCMIGEDGTVAAVLDWEICTLGDPLADVGLLAVYWNDPDDDHPTLLTAPTVVDGFPRRQELLDRYAKTSGRDLSDIDFYVAFGYWKLACIVEGVYARYVGGAMGPAATGFEGFALQVERCAKQAKAALERLD